MSVLEGNIYIYLQRVIRMGVHYYDGSFLMNPHLEQRAL